MNRHAALTTVLAALLLVLGFDYLTFAATGDSLILGKNNKSQQGHQGGRGRRGPR